MKQVTAPIISNSKVMSEARLVWLECPEIATTARPGQFVMVRCGEDTILRRPLSVHQVDKGKLALLFSIVGRGTQWLSHLKAGDTVDIFGPMGNGYTIYPDAKNLLLVAGGIGIAPLYFLFNEACGKNKHVSLIMGADTKNYLYPSRNPDYTIVDNQEFTYTTIEVTNDGSKGRRGMATDLIPDYLDQADQVLACGPVGMYKTMAQMPELKGKSVQISLEIMMGCGVGVCYGCTIKTKSGLKQVCKDGPVFDLQDIIWEEMRGV